MIMILNKPLVFLIVLVLGMQLTACSSTEKVRLCDYKNIMIPEATVAVADEDVMLSVQMQLAEQNPEIEVDVLTDDLAKQYFHTMSAADVYEMVRAEIAEHRAYDYAYSFLLNNSLLKADNQARGEFVQNVLDQIEGEAADAGRALNEYLHTELGTTLLEYMNSAGSFYDEFLILQEFMKAEGIEVTEEEMDTYLQSLASDMGVTVEEILEEYTDEIILYAMYLERSYDALLEYLNY